MNGTQRIHFSGVALAFAAAIAALLIIGTSARAGEVVGRVINATGGAQIQRDGATLPANDGAQIELHDQVTTGPGSTVKLGFPDGSSLALDAGSRVAIDDAAIVNGNAAASRVTLLGGKIHTNVPDKGTGSPPSIEVDTPNARSNNKAPSP
jgi:hypothetical protein